MRFSARSAGCGGDVRREVGWWPRGFQVPPVLGRPRQDPPRLRVEALAYAQRRRPMVFLLVATKFQTQAEASGCSKHLQEIQGSRRKTREISGILTLAYTLRVLGF